MAQRMTQVYNVRVPAELYGKLKQKAAEMGVSINSLILTAIYEKYGGKKDINGRR